MMNTVQKLAAPFLAAPRLWWPVAIVLVAVFAILAVLVAQYIFGLLPCELCLYQRVPYVVAGVFGLAALTFRRKTFMAPAMVALSALSFVINAGLGGFHVGVERHWWDGPGTCSGGTAATGLEALKAQMIADTTTIPCDVIVWDLFGITFAGYNMLGSLALTGFCLWGLWLMKRQKP